MPTRNITRALRALPDALTASCFLALWFSPLLFGEHGVRNGMLIMLVEFMLIHASVFLGHTAFSSEIDRGKKVKMLAVFAAFYSIFIAAFSLAFGQWWPLLAFSWLLLSKFSLALSRNPASNEIRERMMYEWVVSNIAYLGGVFLTLFIPLPMLGITDAVLDSLDLPGSGFWVDKPHQLIAFGFLYFAVLALTKWRNPPRRV